MEEKLSATQAVLEVLGGAIGFVGVAFIVMGVVLALIQYAAHLLHQRYTLSQVKLTLGTYILLGLEFLIGQDVVETVLDPGLRGLMGIGLIVVIRVVLEHHLGKEVEHMKHEAKEHGAQQEKDHRTARRRSEALVPRTAMTVMLALLVIVPLAEVLTSEADDKPIAIERTVLEEREDEAKVGPPKPKSDNEQARRAARFLAKRAKKFGSIEEHALTVHALARAGDRSGAGRRAADSLKQLKPKSSREVASVVIALLEARSRGWVDAHPHVDRLAVRLLESRPDGIVLLALARLAKDNATPARVDALRQGLAAAGERADPWMAMAIAEVLNDEKLVLHFELDRERLERKMVTIAEHLTEKKRRTDDTALDALALASIHQVTKDERTIEPIASKLAFLQRHQLRNGRWRGGLVLSQASPQIDISAAALAALAFLTPLPDPSDEGRDLRVASGSGAD